MGSFDLKLAGVSFNAPDGTDRQKVISKYVKVGQKVFLVCETDNPHDENAIGAWIVHKGFWKNKKFHIGYIPSHLSQRLSGEIQGGKTVQAKVKAKYGGHLDEALGVLIEVKAFYEE